MGKKGGMLGYAVFLVIIVSVILILALIGVTPGTILPQRCDLGDDFRCHGASLQPGEIVLDLENSAGRSVRVKNISVQSIALGNRSGLQTCSVSVGEVSIKRGERYVFNLNAGSDPTACNFNGTRVGKELYQTRIEYIYLDSRNLLRFERGNLLIENP